MVNLIGNSSENRVMPRHDTGVRRLLFLLPLIIYGVGLTHEIAEPWIGLHDWNGAFFSQLARNFLRYPWEIHHGMPIVAVGDAVPSPQERSIYATHPPGLVWLVAGAFQLFGEHEWAARLVPIAASLGSLALLMWIVARGWGRAMALRAGLIYSVMPMAVYFGRMVNHEAVCLFLMLATMAAWAGVVDSAASSMHRRWRLIVAVSAIAGGIWIDWPGIFFAGFFAIAVFFQWYRGIVKLSSVVVVWCSALAATALMLWFLVHFGLADNWGDLIAIFNSRIDNLRDILPNSPWDHSLSNLTWLAAFLACLGFLGTFARLRRSAVDSSENRQTTNGAAGPSTTAEEDAKGYKLHRCGVQVLAITGIAWMYVFWRQYAIHEYWAFYLGPIAALLASFSLTTLNEYVRLRMLAPRIAMAGGFLLLLGTMTIEAKGIIQYFDWHAGASEICVWREVHRRTRTNDRVLLNDPTYIVEQRGQYLFRNIAPPQIAYYMDRAFTVEVNPALISRHIGDCVCFVGPKDAVFAGDPCLAQLLATYPSQSVSDRLIIDFCLSSQTQPIHVESGKQ